MIKRCPQGSSIEPQVPVLIVGGGACGLSAALAARDQGIDALVLERDALPRGSTAMSSGFVPACGTRWQKALGIEDTPALMAQDIQNKNHQHAHPARSLNTWPTSTEFRLNWCRGFFTRATR
jgi:fumarate reductase flavoprotein subunit